MLQALVWLKDPGAIRRCRFIETYLLLQDLRYKTLEATMMSFMAKTCNRSLLRPKIVHLTHFPVITSVMCVMCTQTSAYFSKRLRESFIDFSSIIYRMFTRYHNYSISSLVHDPIRSIASKFSYTVYVSNSITTSAILLNINCHQSFLKKVLKN